MKTSKLYVFRVTVEGHGWFPMDMLRYDRCVPLTELDSNRLNWDGRVGNFEKRQVCLQMYSPHKEGPTKGRWESFGWTVTEVWENAL
jgi:hypothetical protein